MVHSLVRPSYSCTNGRECHNDPVVGRVVRTVHPGSPVVCVCGDDDDDEGYRTNFANIIRVSRGRTEKAGGIQHGCITCLIGVHEGGGDDDCDRDCDCDRARYV